MPLWDFPVLQVSEFLLVCTALKVFSKENSKVRSSLTDEIKRMGESLLSKGIVLSVDCDYQHRQKPCIAQICQCLQNER